jgi:hypothetical protein
MQHIITTDGVQEKALSKLAEKHNAGLPAGHDPADEIDGAGYLQMVIGQALTSYVAQALSIPSAQFVLRFTHAEIGAIMAARQQSAQLDTYLNELTSAPLVYTGSALVRAGMASLVQAGLITQARHDQILDI